jgi:hypothetical protein
MYAPTRAMPSKSAASPSPVACQTTIAVKAIAAT